MSAEITNCDWKFQIQCPARWDNLHSTSEPEERVCQTCMKRVRLCNAADGSESSTQAECVDVVEPTLLAT